MKILIAILLVSSTHCPAQVRVTYYGDTLIGAIKRMTEHRYDWNGYERKSIYSYDATKRLEIANFYSNNEVIGRWYVQFDDNENIVAKNLYCSDGQPCDMSSYEYDLQQRIINSRSVLHLRNSILTTCGNLLDRLQGAMITEWLLVDSTIESLSYQYDSLGRVLNTARQRLYVSPEFQDTAIEIVSYAYKKTNNQTERMTKETFRYGPGRRDTMLEITEYKYDGLGRIIEQNMYSRSSDEASWDSSKTLNKYDTYNNHVETTEYYSRANDHNRNPAIGKMIGAGTEYTYDSVNTIRSSTSYQLHRQNDGSVTKEMSRPKTVRKSEPEQREYDDRGNVIKIIVGPDTTLRREIEYF